MTDDSQFINVHITVRDWFLAHREREPYLAANWGRTAAITAAAERGQ